MSDYIQPSTIGPRVTSPVADKNFADKWGEHPNGNRRSGPGSTRS